MSNYVRVSLLALLMAILVRPVHAASSEWMASEVGQIRLISAQETVGDSGDVRLGLEFALKNGWKVYWRSPGDAGYPPKMDWAGSENLDRMHVFWPTPERFTILGIDTIGYKGALVLPLSAKPLESGKPLRLKLKLDVLACSDICVPVTGELALDLPTGPMQPATQAQAVNQFLSRVPGNGEAQGMKLTAAHRQGANTLIVEAEAEPGFSRPDLFVEGPQGALFAAPKVTLFERGHKARFEVTASELPKEGLTGVPLTFTIADAGLRGMEATLIPDLAAPEAARPMAVSLLAMIGLALLGGLILNLMPCVLPVLSLKILGLVGHGGSELRPIRLSFMASAAGILTSFLLLGLMAVGLKATGSAVGWGLQFQEPVFLSFLAALVVLFAANMAGFYEIGIPHWLGGSGKALGRPQGLAGHFLAGMFATLLATPCSAPFLGTAVGFALAAGPLEIIVIFLCLGLGMAGPYLAVAAWPQLASSMPRPGRWMLSLKRLLALALLGTAFWLLWVIDAQAGRLTSIAVFALLAVGTVLLYLCHRMDARPFGLVAIAAILLAIPVPKFLPAPEPLASQTVAFWQLFDEAAIPRLVANGKVVFVDVTADWCVTCQVNKRLVLDRETIQTLLTQPGVVAMMADWTRPNSAIGDYLAKFGRYGIPFNVVYGPAAPEGIPLPELLSEDAVMDALKRAKAP